MKHKQINWSPFATNILDAEEFDLCTESGDPVDFHRSGSFFVLVVNEKRFETDDNIQMSYIMNQLNIGGLKKQHQ